MKLQSLNEALGQDKADLNKTIHQLEVERDNLVNEKQESEMEKSAIKEVGLFTFFPTFTLYLYEDLYVPSHPACGIRTTLYGRWYDVKMLKRRP